MVRHAPAAYHSEQPTARSRRGDALRLGQPNDVAEVTAAQVHRVVEDLTDMGHPGAGDRDILIVFGTRHPAPAPPRPAAGR